MSSIPKLASPSYIPTDDDILHVRIMTMGVVEHTFKIPLPSVHKGFASPFKRRNGSSAGGVASGDSGSIKSGHHGNVGSGGSGSSSGLESSGKFINMHIYDVGGARGQRHTWASFFEGATAVSVSRLRFSNLFSDVFF